MKRTIRLALRVGLALLILVAAAGRGHPATPAFAASPAGLHVSGTRLVDTGGAAVLLHGVDISGSEFSCAQGGTVGNEGWGIFGGQPEDSVATINAIKGWHANAVRVPLNEDCWLGINGINPIYGGAAYRSAIVKLVGDLSGAGLYVVVDLHWNAPGSAVALSQQPMADEDHGPAFWSSVATTFAANTAVVFDLYNEPFIYGSYLQNPAQDTWSCWLNGCGFNQYLTGKGGSACGAAGYSGQGGFTDCYKWQAAGMQQLVDVVRSTGASNVVVVNGLNWANDDSGWLAHRPTDPTGNLAAGWHEYEGEQCAAVACWSQTISPILQSLPLIVGETGDHTGSGCSLVNMPAFLPWADSNGISYLAWTFNPWQYTHDVLITDWNGTPSSCEGQYYSAHLAALVTNPPAVKSPAQQTVTRQTPSATSPSSIAPSKATPSHSSSLGQTNLVAAHNGGGSQIIYVAIFLLGAISFAMGLAIAMNVGATSTPEQISSPFGKTSLVGYGVAACGALCCACALLLIHW